MVLLFHKFPKILKEIKEYDYLNIFERLMRITEPFSFDVNILGVLFSLCCLKVPKRRPIEVSQEDLTVNTFQMFYKESVKDKQSHLFRDHLSKISIHLDTLCF